MARFYAAAIATYVALLSSLPSTHAQSNDDYNQNLTLRFFTTSQTSSCSYENTTSALTFTTSSIPIAGRCFNIDELFASNASTGYVNQTRNIVGSVVGGEPGIHYQLLNQAAYDPGNNYSAVLYRQHVQNPSDDKYRPGAYADRRVNVYGGYNCTEVDPAATRDEKKPLLPWFGFSCWSEGAGSCGDTPYDVKSFFLNTGAQGGSGKCWDFAYNGAASGGRGVSGWVLMGALWGVVLAIWGAL